MLKITKIDDLYNFYFTFINHIRINMNFVFAVSDFKLYNHLTTICFTFRNKKQEEICYFIGCDGNIYNENKNIIYESKDENHRNTILILLSLIVKEFAIDYLIPNQSETKKFNKYKLEFSEINFTTYKDKKRNDGWCPQKGHIIVNNYEHVSVSRQRPYFCQLAKEMHEYTTTSWESSISLLSVEEVVKRFPNEEFLYIGYEGKYYKVYNIEGINEC